jgi:hypothetical protein
MSDITNPKVFISYSWSSEEHKERVLRWAQDLVGQGIKVLIDRWNLREGQDKYAFMESMVTDAEVNHVLCLSDAKYAEKADKREGGVGTESQIITPQLYAKANQTKFIPIVCEFDAKGEPCLPAFFKSAIYVDFSSPERVNAEWETLVRLIFDKPAIVEPELGPVPAFIKNPQSLPIMTTRKLLSYREAFQKGGSMTELYRNDYVDSVVTDLERFAISRPMGIQTPGTEPFWETLERSLDGMLPYRDELLDFFELHASRKSNDDPTIVANTLERLLPLRFLKEAIYSPSDSSLENYSLFLHELFVYTVALFIGARYFDGCDKLLKQRFYVPGIEQRLGTSHFHFQIFYSRSEVLAQKNEVLRQNRINPIADLLQKRATMSRLPFSSFIEAEFVLFLRSLLHDSGKPWFPHSLVFAGFSVRLPLFQKAAEHSHFLSLCKLLDVADKQALVEKFNEGYERSKIGRWWPFALVDVNWNALLNTEKLDTLA